MLRTIWTRVKSFVTLRSLQTRIFLLILVVGILPCILARVAILNNYEERAVEQRSATVSNQLMIVGNHLLTNNYFIDNGNISAVSKVAINAELEMISNLYAGRVMIINRGLKVMKDTYGISEGKTIISEEVIRCFQGSNSTRYDRENGFIELTTPVVSTGADGKSTVIAVMLTSISNDNIVSTMEALQRKARVLENLIILCILVLAIVLSEILVRPFNQVSNAIMNVGTLENYEPISVPDYVETVHIVDAFNRILKRMKRLDDSRQEFVANVSHELKTPMTSVKVLADSLLAQPDAPAELYREFMEDIVSEIDRENRIITDLLALVRLDKKANGLNISVVNINELTELILKRLRPIARKKDVEVVFESMRQVVAEVDEVKLTLVLTNLVENAIKYNKDHGSVRVELDADHQFFTVKVSDSGLGIPEEAMPHIYERFYRVDKSHSREIGGTGLGLAITKGAVLAHKGSISLTSEEGVGSCFSVKIPLNYIPDTTSAGASDGTGKVEE